MKILLIGNPYLRRDFQAFGHDVKTVARERHADISTGPFPTSIHKIRDLLMPSWEPDLVIVGDDSTHPFVLGLEFLEVPLVWYAIDSHIHVGWHTAYAAVFDVILVAQKDYVDRYVREPDRQVVCWFPLFCDAEVDRDLGLTRDYDLSFVGTLNPIGNPDRVHLIEEIQARFPIYVATGPYVEVFNRSKVILNQCAASDVNFRTFQAMACGGLLLMECAGNGLADLFQDRRDLVCYKRGNAEEIIELAEYYVSRAKERMAIAESGRAAVLAAHTSRHRAQTLLDLITGADLSRAVALRKTRLLHIQCYLEALYRTVAKAYHASMQQEQAGSERYRAKSAIAHIYGTVASAIQRELGLIRKEPAA